MEHATAVVDEMQARTENRPQEPSLPNQCRQNKKYFQKQPWMMHNMHPSSNQALRDPPVVAPTGTTTLSRNWTTPKTATAETPQFSARLNQGTCHCKQQAHPQPTKNCACEISTVCCAVSHCACQDLHAAGLTILSNCWNCRCMITEPQGQYQASTTSEG